MTRLSDLRARLRDLCDKATAGPWHYHEDGPDDAKRRVIFGAPGSGRWKMKGAENMPLEIAAAKRIAKQGPEVDANWRLMAESRAGIPALLDALLAADADRDRLRAALAELLLSPAEATAKQIGGSYGTYDLRQVERAAWEAARVALAATGAHSMTPAKADCSEGEVEPCPHCGKPWWTVQVRCGCTALGTPPDGPSRADRYAAALALVASLNAHAGECREVGPECDCDVCHVHGVMEQEAARSCPASRHYAHGPDCAVANAHARGLLRMECVPDCPTATARRALEEK